MRYEELIHRLRTQSTEIGDRADVLDLMEEAADALAAVSDTTPSEGEREARFHRPETTLAYLKTECAVMDCEHEAECPMREVMICAECLRVAEGAHPGWAESRFDLSLVSWPCSTGATPPAQVDREKLADWYEKNSTFDGPFAPRKLSFTSGGFASALLADFPALAVSPAPARDEWEYGSHGYCFDNAYADRRCYAVSDTLGGILAQEEDSHGGNESRPVRRRKADSWLPMTEEERNG